MLSEFSAWLHQPFNSQMSAARWFAWVGLIIASLILWGLILRFLEEAT